MASNFTPAVWEQWALSRLGGPPWLHAIIERSAKQAVIVEDEEPDALDDVDE